MKNDAKNCFPNQIMNWDKKIFLYIKQFNRYRIDNIFKSSALAGCQEINLSVRKNYLRAQIILLSVPVLLI